MALAEYDPSATYRCLIKHHHFVSAKRIAKLYSFRECQETFHFKRRAAEGSIELGHTEYADYTKDQMTMIADAQRIIIQKLKGST